MRNRVSSLLLALDITICEWLNLEWVSSRVHPVFAACLRVAPVLAQAYFFAFNRAYPSICRRLLPAWYLKLQCHHYILILVNRVCWQIDRDRPLGPSAILLVHFERRLQIPISKLQNAARNENCFLMRVNYRGQAHLENALCCQLWLELQGRALT